MVTGVNGKTKNLIKKTVTKLNNKQNCDENMKPKNSDSILFCTTRKTHRSGILRSPPRRFSSLWGTGYQRKLSFQLKPPHVKSEPVMYSNVSSLMTSMIGQTTAVL